MNNSQMSDLITIKNTSGKAVYVYDWDLSQTKPVAIKPLSGGNPLQAGGSLSLTMKKAENPSVAARRIYFSDQLLSQSLEGAKPASPDAFTPWFDGGIMFSFAEYNYDPSNNRYTFDLSYIDTFSYPITTTFTGGKKSGYVENFEYGFTSLSKVMAALVSSTTWSWSDLIWPAAKPTNPENYAWPHGMYRVIGPNKVWTSNDTFGLSKYAPNSYASFIANLPYNGVQLFKTSQNFAEWLDSTSLPATTGYVKALQSAATPDSNGKYGFFCYPKDNSQGEFTWLSLDTLCTLKIYPFDS